MNRYARDHQQLKRSGRTFFFHDGRFWIFVSEHPYEERTLELTDDYRDQDGDFILPELIAWDGVITCPGLTVNPL